MDESAHEIVCRKTREAMENVERQREDEYRKAAREEWERDGEIEFDENAVVSISEDTDGEIGAYVAAWVWVPKDDSE